jgi:hypothetical protein
MLMAVGRHYCGCGLAFSIFLAKALGMINIVCRVLRIRSVVEYHHFLI